MFNISISRCGNIKVRHMGEGRAEVQYRPTSAPIHNLSLDSYTSELLEQITTLHNNKISRKQ